MNPADIYRRYQELQRYVGWTDDDVCRVQRIADVLENSDVIVVGNAAPEFAEALARTHPDQIILDLVRVPIQRDRIPGEYRGICW